jgi:hypothetical protein
LVKAGKCCIRHRYSTHRLNIIDRMALSSRKLVENWWGPSAHFV